MDNGDGCTKMWVLNAIELYTYNGSSGKFYVMYILSQFFLIGKR